MPRFPTPRNVALFALLVSGCAPAAPPPAPAPAASDAFWANLRAVCGHAFAGRVVDGGPAVLHLQRCTASDIRMRVSVGTDRSRSWVLTRTPGGIRLTHLRDRPDGGEDSISRYGGLALATGSAGEQEFAADSTTAASFPEFAHDTWTMRLEPGVHFAYALRRPGAAGAFHAEWDLSRDVPAPGASESSPCGAADAERPRRNPLPLELRCRYGALGPGRFGLLSYEDVPVYQPRTPLPGTHVVGLTGLPHPRPGESYEAWEWRVLREPAGATVERVYRGLEMLDPRMAERIFRLEAQLAREGVPVRRRETWRSPERQAFLFQQGRSRPGPLATSTLTSWHSHVDAHGSPAACAVDYNVPARHLPRFHQIAAELGLESFGADSNDPGHVFLLPRGAVPERQVALLRLLPRVPEVTLATGRPVDEWNDAISLRLHRAAAQAWLAEPVAPPVPELRVRTGNAPRLRLQPGRWVDQSEMRGSTPSTAIAAKSSAR